MQRKLNYPETETMPGLGGQAISPPDAGGASAIEFSFKFRTAIEICVFPQIKNREMDFFFVGKNNFAVLNAVQPIELPEQWHQQAAEELKTMLLQTQTASLSCK